MAKTGRFMVWVLYSLLLESFLVHGIGDERKVHIIYMGDKPRGSYSAAEAHHSMLQTVLGSTFSARESLVHSYERSFNGFAAKLLDEEVEKMKGMEGVISLIPNQILKLHTTRSWNFMSFSESQSNLLAPQEGDVIVGLLDTGIWPESASFSDYNMTAPPAKWKGTCQNVNFTCNNKIIGARYYKSHNSSKNSDDIISPRDTEGHGSHTASTAAGREVSGASYYGLAEGTARGGVPNARIAVYKVCWSFGCSSVDILKAFDDAIADGVDIISVSLGSGWPVPYMEDVIAIGAFHAMRRGILTSNSAGNSGPYPYSVSNYSPWSLTVAASTIDRKFVSQVVLGNGQIYLGNSINSFNLNGTSYSLVWGGDAANYSAGADTDIARYCYPGVLNSYKVSGKIVFCESLNDGSPSLNDGSAILSSNGVGVIMADSFFSDVAFSYPLPATVISTEDAQKILEYIRSTENPTATILIGETWKDIVAPHVVSFSSRGPNPITPDILKPDLTAPGVDILAAWSPIAPPSIYFDDKRSVDFNIISGTSMSCPHVSGAAAHVKAAHPNWSPAAIKSALMTTAFVVDPNKHPELEFAYGSGHINLTAAIQPGLVYNTSEADYINFLCKQGYNTTDIRLITGDNSSYCNSTVPGRAWDLNYPSFALAVEDGQPINAVFTRTVTNVGSPNSTYTASWNIPSLFNVTVDPPVLTFSNIGEAKTFWVSVNGPVISQQPIVSGAIVWKDDVYVVRSPLVVYNVLPGATNSSSYLLKQSKFDGSSKFPKNNFLRQNYN
ncbi:hypothetical protein K2173_021720 [Erythroxylum novogranatense]|uniref:Cucumisin n=1 Tax=Erythroxylum novogranatense TaxID=1862640 RepID=A0AAV8TJT2_9ROSI|nr:hypothetical protein K2173_021720 [Erythroxylum novogranatense]